MNKTYRALAAAVLSFGAVGTAYVLQGLWNLEPCTMCIIQRYAFCLLGSLALAQSCFGFDSGLGLWGARTLGGGGVLVGLLASAKIQWAISVPSMTCGRDKVAAVLNNAPWVDVWPRMFEATGVCGDAVPPVLGLPFHAWSALLFIVLGTLLLWNRGRAGSA